MHLHLAKTGWMIFLFLFEKEWRKSHLENRNGHKGRKRGAYVTKNA
jgi:hypothetical protein